MCELTSREPGLTSESESAIRMLAAHTDAREGVARSCFQAVTRRWKLARRESYSRSGARRRLRAACRWGAVPAV